MVVINTINIMSPIGIFSTGTGTGVTWCVVVGVMVEVDGTDWQAISGQCNVSGASLITIQSGVPENVFDARRPLTPHVLQAIERRFNQKGHIV